MKSNSTIQNEIHLASSEHENVRTHVLIPRSILTRIDKVVGQRGRSQFINKAILSEFEHLELLAAARAAKGSGVGLERPWGNTSESIAEWVHNDRQLSIARDEVLDEYRNKLSSSKK